MQRFLLAALGMWLMAASAAQAQDKPVSVAAFYGRWVGSGVSETDLSEAFHLTARDFDVEVQAEGDGFRLNWTTVERQKGDPSNPREVRRQAALVFQPAGRPGLWRTGGGGDPLAGQPYTWARLDRQSLVVNLFTVDPGGNWTMQIYRRTLSGLGMELEYTRLADGEPARTAKGRLIKVAK